MQLESMGMGIREERAIQRGGPRNPYGVTTSPELYIIRARPPDAFQIAVATQLRMEQRYQRSTSIGIKAALRDIEFLGPPQWRSP